MFGRLQPLAEIDDCQFQPFKDIKDRVHIQSGIYNDPGHCQVNFHILQEVMFKYNQAVISSVSLYQRAKAAFLAWRQELVEI